MMRGWYISSRPGSIPGDTTNWYTSYWYFIAEYATARFGEEWCLTADQSLSFYSGSKTAPRQVIIRSPKGSNNAVQLMYNTSLFDLKAATATTIYKEPQFGLNLYALPEALTECRPDFFRIDSITARTCLSMVPDAADMLKILLEKGQTVKAGRLAGAFRNIGHTAAADEIIDTMRSLSYDIREEDPFTDQTPIAYTRIRSPYVMRLELMWNKMRDVVIAHFPATDNKH
ncbi:MAG: cell filamentation protein Fic, partial [Prevotellaceae bacterium]|nr:cell filamentation protein Fic [Prevotellaceae bacterium]